MELPELEIALETLMQEFIPEPVGERNLQEATTTMEPEVTLLPMKDLPEAATVIVLIVLLLPEEVQAVQDQ